MNGSTRLTATSRYASVGTAERAGPDGRTIVYLRRRIVPAPERLATIGFHLRRANERLDHVAATQFGDPTQWWRLCDANRAMRRERLEGPAATRLRVAAPEGMPGASS